MKRSTTSKQTLISLSPTSMAGLDATPEQPQNRQPQSARLRWVCAIVSIHSICCCTAAIAQGDVFSSDNYRDLTIFDLPPLFKVPVQGPSRAPGLVKSRGAAIQRAISQAHSDTRLSRCAEIAERCFGHIKVIAEIREARYRGRLTPEQQRQLNMRSRMYENAAAECIRELSSCLQRDTSEPNLKPQRSQSHGETQEFVITPGVSPEFGRRMQEWWQSVPDHIRRMAMAGGIQIIVARHARDVHPAPHQQARRHAHGNTLAQQPGFYYPERRAVVLVENRDLTADELRSRQLQQSKGIYLPPKPPTPHRSIAWHEFGHAIDYGPLKLLTASPEFDHAFHQGLSRDLTDDERARWRYYVTPDAQGNYQAAKEELFAEIFRLRHELHGRFSDLDKRMLEKFSEVVSLMEEHGLF